MNYEEIFETIGISIPNIVLPKKGIDLSKFSVVAVDQYAENDKYWDDVGKIVAGNISSLNLVLPENFFLRGDKDYDKRINTAGRYLENKDLVSYGDCFIFVKRKLKGGTRFGLIAAFDLEQYDYEAGKSNLIKVTEKTDMNRVVPRVALREKIELELPHIFLLISDKQNKLMTYLESTSKNLDALYDFYLMKDGGNIKGYKIDKEDVYQRIADILYEIYEQNDKKFSFAIGDGNHSFAAAKMHYENLKKTLGDKAKDHPARYALAEIINLYDTSMEYEPIHRLLRGAYDKNKALEEISALCGGTVNDEAELTKKYDIQTIQPALDEWLSKNKNAQIEYVHDRKTCEMEGAKEGNLSITFDKFDKDVITKTVVEGRVLVRKSFSMGHPNEKRYYLESRIITNTQ